MKRISLLLSVAMLVFVITSCSGNPVYVNFEELNNGAALRQGDITYTSIGVLPDTSLLGEQYGIINGEDNHKVFLVEGYSPDEWIVEYLDVIMSIHNLYKADSVTEIPDALQTEQSIDIDASLQEQAAIEQQKQQMSEIIDQQQREFIAEQYKVYEQYGLTYDQDTDIFYYEGKTVLFFQDNIDNDSQVSFTRSTGEIGLIAIRNSNNELIGITTVSQDGDVRREAYPSDNAADVTEEAQTDKSGD